MALEDLVRARMLAARGPTPAPSIAPQLDQLLPFPQGLAQRGAAWELPNWGDDMAPGTIPGNDPLRALTAPYSVPGLFGLAGGLGIGQDAYGGGAGGGPLRPGADYSTSPGFSAAPPGQDFQGRDLTPELTNYQGVETTPAYARLIKAAELALGMPEISENAGSDYRSGAEQAALYASHLAGTHPAPVAPPGQSYHEQGEAIDWNTEWLAAHPEVRDFFTQHGVVFDVPGEPWHGHLAEAPHVQDILRGQRSPQRPSPQPSPQPSPKAIRRRKGPSSYQMDPRQR